MRPRNEHAPRTASFSPRRVGRDGAALLVPAALVLAAPLELVYWPAVQMLMWGFLQTIIAGQTGFFAQAGGVLIGAVILWDILFRGQLGFSISFLEEMWSRNLGNLMITPLRAVRVRAGADDHEPHPARHRHRAGDAAGDLVLRLQLLALGLALVGVLRNLIFTSWAVGIFVSGLVLRNGMGAESFAWS